MRIRKFKFLKKEKGQGLAESGLILALVSILAIATLSALGGGINDRFNRISDSLGLSSDELGLSSDEGATVFDDWASNYIQPNPDGEGLIVNSSDDPSVTVVTSESLGYGMLLTATSKTGDVDTFDGLYRYYLANRGHGTELMAWWQQYSGGNKSTDENNATDGDIFIAESLIQAGNRWTAHKDEYHEQAKAILEDILAYNYNPEAQILTVSNWVTDNTKEWTVFRSADITPAFFRHFKSLTGDARWSTIEKSMMKYAKHVSDNVASGLVPDFIDVKSGFGEPVDYEVMGDAESTYYGWSAIRVPIMLTMGSVSSSTKQLVQPMVDFLANEEPLYALYYLEGAPAVNYSSNATLYALQYAQVKLSGGKVSEFNLPNGGYYTDTLYALSRMVN